MNDSSRSRAISPYTPLRTRRDIETDVSRDILLDMTRVTGFGLRFSFLRSSFDGINGRASSGKRVMLRVTPIKLHNDDHKAFSSEA
jgi:hypothetical protein